MMDRSQGHGLREVSPGKGLAIFAKHISLNTQAAPRYLVYFWRIRESLFPAR